MTKLKRVVIKQELVELTGDYRAALILNQFIYLNLMDGFINPQKN